MGMLVVCFVSDVQGESYFAEDDLDVGAMIGSIGGVVGEIDGNATVVSESTLHDADNHVWGASVIKGDDGKYHMFYSIFEYGVGKLPFSDSWVMTSKIAYAVSEYPDRGFVFQKVVLTGRKDEGRPDMWDAQSAHNPHIKYFYGKYYLYYVSSRDPGEQAAGSAGANLSARNRTQQKQCIGVVVAYSIDDLVNGKGKRCEKPILMPRTRVKSKDVVDPSPEGTIAKPDNLIVVNPAVIKRPSDGKYLLYFKGNLYDPGWRGVHGVAIGDTPVGPFKALDNFVFDVKLPDGRIASAEDPYVWYDNHRRLFYAVLKDFSGKITGDKPGLALVVSQDGIEWRVARNRNVTRKQLMFENGKVVDVANLERPQLLTDNFDRPKVLYAACRLKGSKGAAFNVQIPLRQSMNRISQDGKGVVVLEEGKEVLRYLFVGKAAKPYIEKLLTPSGINVLVDSPADHVHHHGIMYAMDVNGVTFWNEAVKCGRELQKHTDDIQFNHFSFNGKKKSSASFTGRIDWVAPAWDIPYIHEKRIIKVNSSDDGPRVVTWESIFSLAKDRKTAKFTGEHFHGLGLRFVPAMNTGGRFFSSTKDEGKVFRGDERLRGGHWCAYTAKAEGKDVTVAMFDGKDNVRKATWFSMTKPFAFFGATIELYKTPYVLEKGKELKLCYGVALWDGVISDEVIETEYRKWLRSK